jgi:hypothetical protein
MTTEGNEHDNKQVVRVPKDVKLLATIVYCSICNNHADHHDYSGDSGRLLQQKCPTSSNSIRYNTELVTEESIDIVDVGTSKPIKVTHVSTNVSSAKEGNHDPNKYMNLDGGVKRKPDVTILG